MKLTKNQVYLALYGTGIHDSLCDPYDIKGYGDHYTSIEHDIFMFLSEIASQLGESLEIIDDTEEKPETLDTLKKEITELKREIQKMKEETIKDIISPHYTPVRRYYPDTYPSPTHWPYPSPTHWPYTITCSTGTGKLDGGNKSSS